MPRQCTTRSYHRWIVVVRALANRVASKIRSRGRWYMVLVFEQGAESRFFKICRLGFYQ